MPDLAYYRSLKKVKRKFDGRHAKFVGLLDHNVVKKSYHETHRDIFEHEVYTLKKLQGLKFIPKLLCVDYIKRTIYMSYCGRQVSNITKYQPKIRKYKKILMDYYGIYHNDIREGNICVSKNGQIYMIDFGWSREYSGVGGYGEGKIGHPKTDAPITKKNLLDLLKEMYDKDHLHPNYLNRIRQIFLREEIEFEDKISDDEDELIPNNKPTLRLRPKKIAEPEPEISEPAEPEISEPELESELESEVLPESIESEPIESKPTESKSTESKSTEPIELEHSESAKPEIKVEPEILPEPKQEETSEDSEFEVKIIGVDEPAEPKSIELPVPERIQITLQKIVALKEEKQKEKEQEKKRLEKTKKEQKKKKEKKEKKKETEKLKDRKNPVIFGTGNPYLLGS